MAGRRDVKAYMVPSAGAPVQEWTYSAAPLGPKQVEVKIECCGVCHSDLHQARNEWKAANYPLVVGHEIIGRVTAIGAEVKDIKEGDRVGVGPQVGCCADCSSCRECKKGEAQLCLEREDSYNTPTGDSLQPYTYGGFSEYIRCNAEWAFPIPDSLPSIQAAPLLCAGITTWMPFAHHKIKAGDKVGIIGIGGLGHVALQFANKLGCHVTAISTSADKEAEAKRLGAQAFLNIKDAEAVKAAANSFDFLLSTISADGLDWTVYISLLRPDSTLCCVGLPTDMKFNPMGLVAKRISITGSILASNSEIRKMFDFCAKHNILAMTEALPMTAENCNVALQKVADNKARYRMVLVNEEMPGSLLQQ